MVFPRRRGTLDPAQQKSSGGGRGRFGRVRGDHPSATVGGVTDEVDSTPLYTVIGDEEVPERSPARLWLVERLSGRLDGLAKEMAEAYVALTAGLPGRHALHGLPAAEAATEQLLHLLRAAATSEVAEVQVSAELEALAELVAELETCGCTRSDVVEVCTASFLVVWEAVNEELAQLPSSMAAAIGPPVRASLLAAMTRSTVMVSEVFDRADFVAVGDAAAWNVLALALDQSRVVDAVRLAHDIGWPVSERHTVIAFSCVADGLSSPWARTANQMVLDTLTTATVGDRPLLTCRHNGLVVAALAHGPSGTGESTEIWQPLVEDMGVPDGYRLLVGVGSAVDDFASLGQSYGQARRALEVARSRHGSSVLVSFADALPDLLVANDATLADDLYRIAIEPLERDRVGTELLSSLEVYVDMGLNAMAAAGSLGIHRHTLSSRLQQIERLTGLRVGDGNQRLLLELGLRARRLRSRAGGEARRPASHRGLPAEDGG